MKKIISTKNAPAAVGPYSQAVMVGDTLYISGQVPVDPATGKVVEGGIEAEGVPYHAALDLTDLGLASAAGSP